MTKGMSKMNNQQRPNPRKVTASQVKSILEGIAEKKVLSVAQTTQTISSSGTVINLTNSIVEGDDIYNRSGTKVKILSQLIRFRFSAVSTNQSARFLLVKDNINTGTTPTVIDILPTASWQSHYSDVRTIQQNRFTILHDETLDVSINGEAVKSVYKRFTRKYPVFYNGATAVSSSNGKGATFLVVIGSSSTGIFDYDWQGVFNDS